MKKLWEIAPLCPQSFVDEFPEQHSVVLQLLWNRNLRNRDEISAFLNPNYETSVNSPFLFSQMSLAVKTIWRTLQNKEKIIIYGDYDADGVTGTAVLASVLREISIRLGRVPNDVFDIYLPHRENDGYGLKEQTVADLIKRGAKLLITVDCGISNGKEISLAKNLGAEVIVVDHHEAPAALPEAIIIHPDTSGETYPFKKLPAVSVAWKLACALLHEARERKIAIPHGYEKWLLDLVAIATVTEIVPLLGENRALLKYGLLVLNKTRRPGLQKLIALSRRGGAVGAEEIAFQLGPRINAASRMEHALLAYNLLTTESEEDAERLSQKLEEINLARRRLTEKITAEAVEAIGEVGERCFLCAAREGWPAGMMGLVAGKIAERFYRPTMLLGKNGNMFVGSARSVPEFHITQALAARDDLLIRYGGHPAAAGLTVQGEKTLAELTEHLNQRAAVALKDVELAPKLLIDAEPKWEDIGWTLQEAVEQFEPFGAGNPRPKFLLRDVEVVAAEKLGADGKHLRLLGRRGDAVKKFIGFGFGKLAEELMAAKRFDCVFELGVNTWNGNRELQLKVVDLKAKY